MPTYWLAVGSSENWRAAFALGSTWGLKPRQKGRWEQVKVGDILVFYVTRPVGGVIGYGVAHQKLKQDRPFWPEEIAKDEVIWPYRIVFDVGNCLPDEEWLTGKVSVDRVNFRAKKGFQPLPEELAQLVLAPFQEQARPPAEARTLHDELIALILAIGRLQGYICQANYRTGRFRLDVVWRRLPQSVPNYVFEVQVEGNLSEALARLKHAVDLWNSHIYLIARTSDRERMTELLSGAFHEIQQQLIVVEPEVIRELGQLKEKVRVLEAKLHLAPSLNP